MAHEPAKPEVTIYSTATCVFCRAEKQFLDEHEVPYKTIMVDEDPALADELLEISGGLSVPYTIIRNGDKTDQILGFDQPRITAALGL